MPLVAALLALAAVGCGSRAASPSQKILFLSDRDGDWALYAMDANGRHEHRVFSAGRAGPYGAGVGFGEPLVSPDGRKVLLSRDGISVATLATGRSQRVGAGEEGAAAWSPDGNRLALSGPWPETRGLYVVDVRSGRRRTLLRASVPQAAAWSPDGSWIAFARQIGYGPPQLYLVHPDGSGLRRLSGYAPQGNLAWSRDGRLAFIGGRGTAGRAHLIVIDVRARRVRIMRPRLGGQTVAWSPDDRTIAYSDGSAIFTVNADGSGQRRLTSSRAPYSDDSPVWSPDGEDLLFVRTPHGGGAEQGIPQVWRMHADGSQQRRLTTAYPDGGDNVEPAWIPGAVHGEAAPRLREVRRSHTVVLRVPFPVDGIAADDARAAIAPAAYEMERDIHPTPPILLWRPGHGDRLRLAVSVCGGVSRLVLVRSRLAFDCDRRSFDHIAQAVWVFDLRTRRPHQVFHGEAGRSAADIRGLYVDAIVGGGGVLAFGSERVNAHGVALRRTLWRIDRFDGVALRSGNYAGYLVGARRGRLVIELPDGRVAILGRDGTPVRVLRLAHRRSLSAPPLGFDGKPSLLLRGRELLVLEHGTLRAYDTATGKLGWHRRLAPGAQLEGADGGLLAYTAGAAVHLLSRGRETIVRVGGRPLRRFGDEIERPVHADLTAAGLFYCFSVADSRYPGRVVFVPRAALPQ